MFRNEYKPEFEFEKGLKDAEFGQCLLRVVRCEEFPVSIYRQYYTDIGIRVFTLAVREGNPSTGIWKKVDFEQWKYQLFTIVN